MMHIALVEPEIAPNTGNIARLCAATGSRLHLIGRLGFRLDARSLRRAGVDYWAHVDIVRHADWEAFAASLIGHRRWAFSARGSCPYTSVRYAEEDVLVFGCESRGLPARLLETKELWNAPPLSLPILNPEVRSLNLATAVGIALYESLRQVRAW